MDVKKYLRKPAAEPIVHPGQYDQFNLKENPFPSSPFVNPESSDARINGSIYEPSIRQAEYDKVSQNFLQVRLNDPNHLRLGYIVDTSYVVRGNGKSAFVLDLQKRINQDFGLSVSQGLNKCFAIILAPEPSGRTKTFDSFVHLLADAIFRSNFIEDALTTLRLEAILALDDGFDIGAHFKDEDELRDNLQSSKWYTETGIDFGQVTQQILVSPFLQSLPRDFPLFAPRTLWPQVASQKSFLQYYQELKRGDSRTDFVFSHLVSLFMAAGFNGAYVFVDDFERIPEFQSERQRRDFARGLRTCLFDGLFTSARAGFYTFMLVLHAGVPRLVQSAWEASGLEHRAPIFYKVGTPKHLIRFEKITLEHARSLLQTYLKEYRITPTDSDGLAPFTEDAVAKISELSDSNASKILKMAYEILERAVVQNVSQIDIDFVLSDEEAILLEQKQARGINDTSTKDLPQEAQ
jgi:hypothetical protein